MGNRPFARRFAISGEVTGKDNHYTYTVGDLPPFQVCDHHRGQSQLKSGYVKVFISRMIELGRYED
jgi:hypothetical protein